MVFRALAALSCAAASQDGGQSQTMGACGYLQRLPPVLRRSVCGTGARQHTRAVWGWGGLEGGL